MANKYRKKSNSANGPRTAKTFCKRVHQHQLRQHCGPQVFGITGCNACVVSNTKGVIELPMGDSDTYDVHCTVNRTSLAVWATPEIKGTVSRDFLPFFA